MQYKTTKDSRCNLRQIRRTIYVIYSKKCHMGIFARFIRCQPVACKHAGKLEQNMKVRNIKWNEKLYTYQNGTFEKIRDFNGQNPLKIEGEYLMYKKGRNLLGRTS